MVRTYFQSRTEFKENNPLKNPLSSMVYSSDGTCWGRIKENRSFPKKKKKQISYCSRSKQMPWTDQMTEITPNVLTYISTLPSSFEYLYTGWDCRPYGGKMQRGSIYIEIIQNSNFVRKKNWRKTVHTAGKAVKAGKRVKRNKKNYP